MANSGAHTNGSQFFVCYKSAAHLDGKHSVFGAVVGGMETLAKMERVPTDADDRPSPSGAIVIESVEVFVDPYEDAAREEAEAAEKKREDEARDERERLEALNPGRWWSNPAGEAARAADDAPTAKAGGGVGSTSPPRRNGGSRILPRVPPSPRKPSPPGVGTGTLTRGDAAVRRRSVSSQ